MKILIDTSPLKNQSANRGIGRYTSELVNALRALNSSHEFFTSEDQPKSIDLVHYPFFDLFFPTLPLFKRAKTIVTIHDVIPLVFSKHYPPGLRGTLSHFYQKLSLKNVAHVITDSEVSKRDIETHLHLPSDKITSVPLAAQSGLEHQSNSVIDSVRRKYNIPKYYFLYVGDINYNKNLPFLISLMPRFKDYALVLVSKAATNTTIPEAKAIHTEISKHDLEKRVHIVPGVADTTELAALYSGATLYIQPSLYEGFGLPVLEAMHCRCPVVCSRGGSLPEVVGEYAPLFHPMDTDDAYQTIHDALKLTDMAQTKRTRAAFEWASHFTWENTAKETLAVYESA